MRVKYHKYLWYVVRHKWFVAQECFKVGLFWRGIVHDIDKFLPDEFIPYAKHFFGPDRDIHTSRNKTGYYKPTNTGDPAFDYAWFLHTKRNKHHWQYWCIPEQGEGAIIPVVIPLKYVKEMICDWKGAAKAQHSKSTVQEWYEANKNKMILHHVTRGILEVLLHNK